MTSPEFGGKHRSWCSETVSTEGSSPKIAWAPLPWWTSQSTMAIRSMPSSACACRAAIATLLKMQNPRPVSGSAWWPAGLTSAYPLSTVPSTTASVMAIALPAPSAAIPYAPLPNGEMPSPASPPLGSSLSRWIRATCSGVCTRVSCASVAVRGAIRVRWSTSPETQTSSCIRRLVSGWATWWAMGCRPAVGSAGNSAPLPVSCQPKTSCQR